jgi:hypothetical protein
MTVDRAFVEMNRAATARLRNVAARLTEAQFNHPVGEHWTVSVAFVHIAFWEGRVLYVLNRTEKEQKLHIPEIGIVVNDVSLPIWKVVPAREATRLAIEAAETVDARLEAYPEALLAEVAAYNIRWIERARHRNEHLDEVEAALKR